MINNFNPIVMTCVRSNHDVKFIPSGKDGKNIAFYVTNYATKDQMSTHNMVPLIAASKKRLDEDPSFVSADKISKAKGMITKCLNRITTEHEISAPHAAYFVHGNKDCKTSHKFTTLSLHSAWAWLINAIKEFENDDPDDSDENATATTPTNPDESDDENDENDDSLENVDEHNDDEVAYVISTGNDGYVLTNQMIDYLYRGDGLKHMCLWEYCSKVYKKKFSDEDLKKLKTKKKTNRNCEQVQQFSADHPQSETHWQRVRLDRSSLIPTLSKLPPTSRSNKLKNEKCMLLLFKPYTSFEELYNGKSWHETYAQFLEATENRRYIDNMNDFLNGIEESKENVNDEANEELADEIEDDFLSDDDQSNETEDSGLDVQTTEALEVIRTTPWLDESISSHQSEPSRRQEIDESILPPSKSWENDMKEQNQYKIDHPESEDEEDLEDLEEDQQGFWNEASGDADTEFTAETVQIDDIRALRDNIATDYTLNRKQKMAFEIATDNIIKGYFKESTDQLIGYVGGPGGTGKSQIIKAMIEFHRKMKLNIALKRCANTGTAAKHIGGSTTTTLFSFSSRGKNETQNLQKKFEKVDTIIVDEVSMIGCSQLVKIHRALCFGKGIPSSQPFGGIDIWFFGDFIQFPPVKDHPLYVGWAIDDKKSRSKKADENRKLGANLWKQINCIILLDEQMRCTDPVYLQLLNRLREGKCTDVDAALLNTRVVGADFDITSIIDAPITVPGNQLVMAINDLFISRYSLITTVFVSRADDYLGKKKEGRKVPKKVANKIQNWPNTYTGGLPREIRMFLGMPIMVTCNIATELGITNGTVGKIRSIHLKNGEMINGLSDEIEVNPDYIIVELEDVSFRPLDGLPPNHVPIFLRRESFQVHLPGRKKKVSVNRIHFPLVPLFSCTTHKSQGQTLKKAIVDLIPRGGSTRGLGIEFAYVPLSRVRRLQDLTILRPFDPAILNIQMNDACARMMAEYKERDVCKDM